MKIIKICEENSIYCNVFTQDTIITTALAYNVLFYNEENKSKPEDKKTKINIVENLYSYIENSNNMNFLKITICDNHKIIFGGILRKLKTIKDIDILEVAHMSRKIIKIGTKENQIEYFYTEITNKGVDKWNAITYLAEKLNIKKEEIIAIGDNINDITMITNAGCGVAMGNSNPTVKKQADLIVLDNNNSGVAQALKKLVIKE